MNSLVNVITAKLIDGVRVPAKRLRIYALHHKLSLGNMNYREKLEYCRQHACGKEGKRFYQEGKVRKEPYPRPVARQLFPPSSSEEEEEEDGEGKVVFPPDDECTEERVTVDVAGEWDQFYTFPPDLDLPVNDAAMGLLEDDACICSVGKFNVTMRYLQEEGSCEGLDRYQKCLAKVCEARRKFVREIAGREYTALPRHASCYVVQLPYQSSPNKE